MTDTALKPYGDRMKPAIKLNHVAIAVSDLAKATATYQSLLGAPPVHTELVPDQKVMTVFFQVGDTHIELLQATDPQSPIAQYLAKHPRGGLHHLCIEVDDLEEKLAGLIKEGFKLIDTTPRAGAHGCRVAFVHPHSCEGVLIEIAERGS